MLFEGDLPVRNDLLEPCEAPTVRVDRRDDVVATVAVNVVSEHLRTTLVAELEFVTNPFGVAIGRLFVPAFVEKEIEAPVAIHIAKTGAMIELLQFSFVADPFEGPCVGGVLPVGLNQ